MASGQPDYTRQVAVTVFDTPDPITVNVENTATPVNVEFPSSQNVVVTSMPTSSGVQVKGQDAKLTTTPDLPYTPGRSKAYENADFTDPGHPVTHDVNTGLGRNGRDGYIHNAGSGDLKWAYSDNGADYGDDHILKAGAKVRLTGLNIDSIKITWVAYTEYYIAVV